MQTRERDFRVLLNHFVHQHVKSNRRPVMAKSRGGVDWTPRGQESDEVVFDDGTGDVIDGLRDVRLPDHSPESSAGGVPTVATAVLIFSI